MKQTRQYFLRNVRTFFMGFTLALMLVGSTSNHVFAVAPPAMASPAGLAVSQLKITGDEFIVLTNNTGGPISNLSSYWLYAFNNANPLAAGVSSSSQQLPTVSLGAGQTVLLSSDGMATCGAAIADKLSISLGDSSGYLQLVQMGMNANGVTQTSIDSVSWSSATTGTITSVPSNTKDPNALYYRYQLATSPNFGWQLADLDNTATCKYNVTIGTTSTAVTPTQNGLTSGSAVPPVKIEELDQSNTNSDSGASTTALPTRDIGLLAPVINELLPNPASPHSDEIDEFIELYNPNDTDFDLTGFSLQVGSVTSTTTHVYAFPSATILKAKSFVAYTSAITKLGMSNTAGQVWLLDGYGNVVGQTAAYSNAKDGQAWALANGSWYWSTTPTPNEVNRMTTATKKAITNKAATATKTAAKKASANSATKKKKTTTAKLGKGTTDVASVTPRPIHSTVLVVVASLAVLYGAYEYRHDIANALHRLRTHRADRRGIGEEIEGGRTNRIGK